MNASFLSRATSSGSIFPQPFPASYCALSNALSVASCCVSSAALSVASCHTLSATLFFRRTIDSRTALLASALCSAHRLMVFSICSSASLYGFSNKPSLFLSCSTLITASSTSSCEIFPSFTSLSRLSAYAGVHISISTPVSIAFIAASVLSSQQPCATISQTAPQSDMSTPSKPHSPRRTSLISHLLPDDGTPFNRLKDVMASSQPASTAALYAGR